MKNYELQAKGIEVEQPEEVPQGPRFINKQLLQDHQAKLNIKRVRSSIIKLKDDKGRSLILRKSISPFFGKLDHLCHRIQLYNDFQNGPK